MKKLNIIGIVAFVILMLSCKKEENAVPFNTQILKNWEFVKFCDNQGNELHSKDFNTDTIPYFSMNLNLYEAFDYLNDRRYVSFAGKGPINFFKGTFMVTADSIKHENTFEVSHFQKLNNLVAAYDRLYIDALSSVSNYEVRNDSLFVVYDNSSKKMVFVQKPEIYDTSSIYLKARIANSISFEVFDKKSLQAKIKDISFDDGNGMEFRYLLDIDGEIRNSNYLQSIEFGVIMNPVMKGKYQFSEDADLKVGQATGRYVDSDLSNHEYTTYYRKSGEIEIIDITSFYIKGKFRMTVTDKRGNDPLFEIKDGEFIIPIIDLDVFTSYKWLSYYDSL